MMPLMTMALHPLGMMVDRDMTSLVPQDNFVFLARYFEFDILGSFCGRGI